MHRIHVVGCSPRSGTTLMAELLRSCFEVDWSFEHEVPVRSRPRPEGDVLVSKAPRDAMTIGAALLANPRQYGIYLVRDPRDVVTSKHRKAPDRYWAGFRFYAAYARAYDRLKEHPRFVPIRYEDLVSDPDAVQERLQAQLPFLVPTRKFSRFDDTVEVSERSAEALGGARQIDDSSVGKWREHLPRVKGQLRLHPTMADRVISMGYEPNHGWLALLEGVEPDLSESYWAERFSKRQWARFGTDRVKTLGMSLVHRLVERRG